MATTETLCKLVLTHHTPEVAYRKLLKLSRMKLIQSRGNISRDGFIWVLTDKGFRIAEQFLPEMMERGYKSEAYGHDLMVMAVHLGTVIEQSDLYIELVTEQELRRLSTKAFPGRFRPDSDQRPDGYWIYPSEARPRKYSDEEIHQAAIALEVHNSHQSRDKLEAKFIWYEYQEEIDRVLWIGSTKPLARELKKALLEYRPSERERHLLGEMDEFLRNGVNMRLETVDGAPLILADVFREAPLHFDSKAVPTVDSNPCLNLSKTAFSSRNYATVAKMRNFV